MKATKTTTPLRDRCLSHCATLGIPLEGRIAGRTAVPGGEREPLSSALPRSAAGDAGRRAPRTRRRAAHPGSSLCGEQDLGGVRLAVQSQSLRPRADRRTGHRRFHPAPQQPDHGRLERDRKESHHSGAGAEGLRPRLPRSVSHLRRVTRRPDRFTRRQNSSRASALLRAPGSC